MFVVRRMTTTMFPTSARTPMLISTDILETALAGILQTLQRQSLDIAELKTRLAESVPRADVIASHGVLLDRIQALERRVGELDAATVVSIPGDA